MITTLKQLNATDQDTYYAYSVHQGEDGWCETPGFYLTLAEAEAAMHRQFPNGSGWMDLQGHWGHAYAMAWEAVYHELHELEAEDARISAYYAARA